MTEGLVSIFALTWERFELSKETFDVNLKNMEGAAPYELLVCDQGSKDKRIVDYVSKLPKLSYHRKNSRNEGVGKAFNQLFLRSKGEFLCFMGSDLQLPRGWMKEMLGYVKGVKDSGMIGMDWGHGGVPPLTFQHGSHAHWLTPHLNRIFGVWIMRRSIVDRVGLFPESYDVYGLEDSSFNERVNRFGFKSLYVPNTYWKCKHVGVGSHDSGEYRAMKNKSMGTNLGLFHEEVRQWDAKEKCLYEPLPEMREPL